MIKVADIEDIDIIIEMSKKFHEQTPYKDMKFDREKVRFVIEQLVSDLELGIVILSLEEFKPVGMIIGMSVAPTFSHEQMATELAWWIDPDYRNSRKSLELIEAYEYWARKVGCKRVQMVCLDDRVGKYYQRRGYNKLEEAYSKEL